MRVIHTFNAGTLPSTDNLLHFQKSCLSRQSTDHPPKMTTARCHPTNRHSSSWPYPIRSRCFQRMLVLQIDVTGIRCLMLMISEMPSGPKYCYIISGKGTSPPAPRMFNGDFFLSYVIDSLSTGVSSEQTIILPLQSLDLRLGGSSLGKDVTALARLRRRISDRDVFFVRIQSMIIVDFTILELRREHAPILLQ